MMKYLYTPILFILLTCAANINAQDENTYMHYIQNPILMNVGATGFYQEHRGLIDYRNQWSDFDGAPRNYLLSYHTGINGNMGLGGLVSRESLGAINRTRLRGSYAYQLPFENGKLGLGISAEYQQENLRSDALSNPLIDRDDVFINELSDGVSYFDVDFGAFAEFNESLVLGVSATDLVRSRIDATEIESDSTSTFFEYFNAFAGYKINIEDIGVSFYPSIFYRKSFTYESQTDINLLVSFLDDQLSTGVSYGIGGFERWGFLLGLQLNKVHINYSYDISQRDFQQYNGGAHELSIGLRIPYNSSDSKASMENGSTENQ